jgi:hypothetical protein
MSHKSQSEYAICFEVYRADEPKPVACNVEDDHGPATGNVYLICRRKSLAYSLQGMPAGLFRDLHPVDK